MDARGLCVWNGEWGPVYARKEYEGEHMDEINERRYNVLNDQLQLYAKVSLMLRARRNEIHLPDMIPPPRTA